jgi:hypothetical protein
MPLKDPKKYPKQIASLKHRIQNLDPIPGKAVILHRSGRFWGLHGLS